jgi:hypothetical protein
MPVSSTGRRAVLRAGCLGLVVAALGTGRAGAQGGTDPAGSVEAFSNALLKSMRAGSSM